MTVFVYLILSLVNCLHATTLDFVLVDGNKNLLKFECLSDSNTPPQDGNIEYRFSNENDPLLPDSSDVRRRLVYEIDSQSEGFVQCFFSGVASPSYVFATIPSNMDSSSTTINVARSTEAELVCPIPMSRVRDLLPVYQISWRQEEQNFPTMINREMLPYGVRLSPDDITLHVRINDSVDTRMYRCYLVLRRCNITATEVDPCKERVVRGPTMTFNVYVPIRGGTVMPGELSVMEGEAATFNCSVIGTGINITWKFNDSTINVSVPGVLINESRAVTDDADPVVESILIINTREFSLQIGVAHNFQCIVHQISPVPRERTFGVTLEILSEPTPTSSTTNQTPSSSTTTTFTMSSSSSPQVVGPAVGGAVAGIMVILLITVFIVITCCVCNHKRKKPKLSTFPPPIVTTHTRTRIYEELPCTILGTEHLTPPRRQLQRQNGVSYDKSNPKADTFSYQGSDDPICYHSRSGGSELSGLSGVSGNDPRAHKMPTYTQDSSVVSDSLHVPSWDTKRFSNSTFNSGQTQSTLLMPSDYSSEHHLPSRSYTDVGYHHPQYYPQPPTKHHPSLPNQHYPQPFDQRYPQYPHRQYGSAGNIRDNQEILRILMKEQSYTPDGYSRQQAYSDSRYSSSQTHVSQHNISDETLLHVMNCLMHNKDCEIIDCPCRQVQERFRHLNAVCAPMLNSERKKPRKISVPSSSTESESESNLNTRRANLRPLILDGGDNNKLHPHYHMGTKSHIRRAGSHQRASRRRSRSLSDLTPITETRETPTPMVGGIIKAETPIFNGTILGEENSIPYQRPSKEDLMKPRLVQPLPTPSPLLLKERSLSSDNLPILCLNNCLLEIRTPSPRKHAASLADAKLSRRRSSNRLKTVQEVNNGTETDSSNTSSRSRSPSEPEAVKSSQSDNDEGTENSLISNTDGHLNCIIKRGTSSGYGSQGELNSYDSLQFASQKKRGNQFPSNSSRSSSPFETETTRSNDGTIVHTTEC